MWCCLCLRVCHGYLCLAVAGFPLCFSVVSTVFLPRVVFAALPARPFSSAQTFVSTFFHVDFFFPFIVSQDINFIGSEGS